MSYATLWVCVDCMMVHANGETEGEPDRVPWAIYDDARNLTMGLMREEHECESDGDGECDCETLEFSWSACEGCGSALGGSRYAFTEHWEES